MEFLNEQEKAQLYAEIEGYILAKNFAGAEQCIHEIANKHLANLNEEEQLIFIDDVIEYIHKQRKSVYMIPLMLAAKCIPGTEFLIACGETIWIAPHSFRSFFSHAIEKEPKELRSLILGLTVPASRSKP